jgi:hypothetical protein
MEKFANLAVCMYAKNQTGQAALADDLGVR